jgi:hypothetical protein
MILGVGWGCVEKLIVPIILASVNVFIFIAGEISDK